MTRCKGRVNGRQCVLDKGHGGGHEPPEQKRALQKRYEVDLDIAKDPPDSDATVKAAAARYGLTARLLRRVGPGGGWPQWLFGGSEGDLRRFVLEWYLGGDGNMLEDLLEGVTEVTT